MGDQVVAKGVSWRLPVPSFPAQKTQDTSNFCKLEKGSRQGKMTVMNGVRSIRVKVVGSPEGANGPIRKERS